MLLLAFICTFVRVKHPGSPLIALAESVRNITSVVLCDIPGLLFLVPDLPQFHADMNEGVCWRNAGTTGVIQVTNSCQV